MQYELKPKNRLTKLISLSCCVNTAQTRSTPIAYHAGRYYSGHEFYTAVKFWVQQLRTQPQQRYALYTHQAYPAAVLLFALFHADKEVWLAANNRPATAQQLRQQDCQLIGDWTEAMEDLPGFKNLESLDANLVLAPLNLEQTRLIIFTSGSTGHAKAIEKTLSQLQSEIETLEQQWGQQLANAQVLATVSHQHIYGLLFRLLWPLAASRCFHSETYLSAELVLTHSKSTASYWIASPAQLKRLEPNTAWDNIARLTAIFSSGGALPESSRQQIAAHSHQQVIEIYGSTETGGIAWRQQATSWQLFNGMKLHYVDAYWQLQSPYLGNQTVIALDDLIDMEQDGRFTLQGRRDRIVKIEEKRLSLTELEQCLIATDWITDAVALKITTIQRELVACAIVLSESGLTRWQTEGRNAVIKQLRTTLHQSFDALFLPRKWLLLNQLPITAQGKINLALLETLFNLDPLRFPQLQAISFHSDQIEIQLKVPANLIYFPDHFRDYPILPGVVQIAWVDYLGKLFFNLNLSCFEMEVIKFVKLIKPGEELRLALQWKAETQKLYFSYASTQGTHSSGRLIFKQT